MNSIIAIKNEMHPDLVSSETFEERRQALSSLRFDPSKRSQTLSKIGMKEIKRFQNPHTIIPEAELFKKNGSFIRLPFAGAYILNIPDEKNIEKVKAEVFDKDYVFIENTEFSLSLPTHAPDQLLTKRNNTAWHKNSGIEGAHEAGLKGQNVMICVPDTGCNADHFEFRGKNINFISVHNNSIIYNRRAIDPINSGDHGTHICGTICGTNHGILPQADLYVASIFNNSDGNNVEAKVDKIMLGLDWFLENTTQGQNTGKTAIVNCSFGFPVSIAADPQFEPLIRHFENFIERLARDFGILFVAAAGNKGQNALFTPGTHPSVLSVGAVDENLQLAGFSSYGVHKNKNVPDVVGLGVKVYSSTVRNANDFSYYGLKSGTSMASPYVCGIAGLYGQRESISGLELKDKVMETALPLPDYKKDEVGAGFARYIP